MHKRAVSIFGGVIIPPGGGVLEPERMVSVIDGFLFYVSSIIKREIVKNNGFFFMTDKSLTKKALFV